MGWYGWQVFAAVELVEGQEEAIVSVVVGLVKGQEEAIGRKSLDMWSIESGEFEGIDMTRRWVGLVQVYGTISLAGEEYVVVVAAAAAGVVDVGGLEGERRRVCSCYLGVTPPVGLGRSREFLLGGSR